VLESISVHLQNNSAELKELTTQNKILASEVKELKKSNEQLSYELRKQGLILFGLPESDSSKETDLESKVYKLFEKQLKIQNVEIDTCFRLGKKTETKLRPVKMRFVRLRDRNAVWLARLKLTKPYHLNENLTPEARATRKILIDARNAATDDRKDAKILWSKNLVIIDGESFHVIGGKLQKLEMLDDKADENMDIENNGPFLENHRTSRGRKPKKVTATKPVPANRHRSC